MCINWNNRKNKWHDLWFLRSTTMRFSIEFRLNFHLMLIYQTDQKRKTTTHRQQNLNHKCTRSYQNTDKQTHKYRLQDIQFYLFIKRGKQKQIGWQQWRQQYLLATKKIDLFSLICELIGDISDISFDAIIDSRIRSVFFTLFVLSKKEITYQISEQNYLWLITGVNDFVNFV